MKKGARRRESRDNEERKVEKKRRGMNDKTERQGKEEEGTLGRLHRVRGQCSVNTSPERVSDPSAAERAVRCTVVQNSHES